MQLDELLHFQHPYIEDEQTNIKNKYLLIITIALIDWIHEVSIIDAASAISLI
jgi:hypothetical protein